MGQSSSSKNINENYKQRAYLDGKVCQSEIGNDYHKNNQKQTHQENMKERGYQEIHQKNSKQTMGLPNIGNTCFLNSIIQLLISSKFLRQKIIFSRRLRQKNQKCKNQILTSLSQIFNATLSNYPGNVKRQIMKKIVQFLKKNNFQYQSYSQQDSLHFLMFILNHLFKDFEELQNSFTIQYQIKCFYCNKSDLFEEFTLSFDTYKCNICKNQKQIVFVNQPKLIIMMTQEHKDQIRYKSVKNSSQVYSLKSKILYSGNGSSGHYVAVRKKINAKESNSFYQYNDDSIYEYDQSKNKRWYFKQKVCLYELKQLQNAVNLQDTTILKKQYKKKSAQSQINEASQRQLETQNDFTKAKNMQNLVKTLRNDNQTKNIRIYKSQQCLNDSIERQKNMQQFGQTKFAQFPANSMIKNHNKKVYLHINQDSTGKKQLNQKNQYPDIQSLKRSAQKVENIQKPNQSNQNKKVDCTQFMDNNSVTENITSRYRYTNKKTQPIKLVQQQKLIKLNNLAHKTQAQTNKKEQNNFNNNFMETKVEQNQAKMQQKIKQLQESTFFTYLMVYNPVYKFKVHVCIDFCIKKLSKYSQTYIYKGQSTSFHSTQKRKYIYAGDLKQQHIISLQKQYLQHINFGQQQERLRRERVIGKVNTRVSYQLKYTN